MKKILFFVLFLSLFLSAPALASEPEVLVKDDSYAASFVSQSIVDPIVLEQGESKNIIIKFKNNSGCICRHYLSVCKWNHVVKDGVIDIFRKKDLAGKLKMNIKIGCRL